MPKAKCPLCKGLIETGVSRCRLCQGDLSDDESQQALKKSVRIGCLPVLLMVIASFTIIAFVSTWLEQTFDPKGYAAKQKTWEAERQASEKARAFEESKTVKMPSLKLGDECITNCGVMGADDLGRRQFDKAVQAQDHMGAAQMLLDGLAHQASTGTRVQVIDRDFTCYKIRILEGKAIGKAIWIPKEWVSPIPEKMAAPVQKKNTGKKHKNR